jgi:hypothetical protein
VRRLNDPMMRALRDADPGSSPDVTSWAESNEAASIADRIRTEGDRDVPTGRQPTRKRPSRRLVIVLALVAVVASAVAASVALRPRSPVSTSVVACYSELDRHSGLVLVGVHDDVAPVELCGRAWQTAFGTRRPSQLIACVRAEGGLAVYPLPRGISGPDACGEVGAAPYSTDVPPG